MVAVDVVEVAINQIIDMIAVGQGFMPASGTVTMTFLVFSAVVVGSAFHWICGGDGQLMFFDRCSCRVVQMTVVQVICVTFMLDRGVATFWAVFVGVVFVMNRHVNHSFLGGTRWNRNKLARVRQCVQNQVGNVPICECVINVVALSPSDD